MDEELQFFTILNDDAAAHSAKREKERRESRAARDQKRAENKAKQDRVRRIHWWLGLVHRHIRHSGCACAIFLFLLFGLPENLALIAAERGIHKSSVCRCLQRAEKQVQKYLKY